MENREFEITLFKLAGSECRSLYSKDCHAVSLQTTIFCCELGSQLGFSPEITRIRSEILIAVYNKRIRRTQRHITVKVLWTYSVNDACIMKVLSQKETTTAFIDNNYSNKCLI